MSTRFHINKKVEHECFCGDKHEHERCFNLGVGVNRHAGYSVMLYLNPYCKNVKELKHWSRDGNIYNEYGKPYTHREFWDMVDESQKINPLLEDTQCGGFIDGYRFYFNDNDMDSGKYKKVGHRQYTSR